MARRENEMADLIVESAITDDLDYADADAAGETNGEEAPPKNDLILDEALNIMLDMIELRQDTPAEVPARELSVEPDALTADAL